MTDKRKMDLERAIIPKLYGKLQLLQSPQEKEKYVEQAVRETLMQDESRRFKKDMEELANQDAMARFVQEFLSYGIIREMLSDTNVEDIIINSLNPIYIHHSQTGLTRTNERFCSLDDLEHFVRKLILFSGRERMEKILNFELPNLEGRVNLVKSPFGPQLTITKAKMTPLSILDLIKTGAMDYQVAGQLWLYLEGMSIRPANMIIAGGPGVGKTTLLNALFSFIPKSHRMVVIEDTLELNTSFEDSCSRLESGEDFNLADLVKNSLRMRPERIIVGEVRGEEARDMMTAVNIGKYCIGTIHSLSSREAIIRLQNEPMNIPEQLVRLIDVFIVLKRYHVEGRLFRIIDEVSETSGMEQEKVLLSQIYKFNYEKNRMEAMSTSTVYRDRLAQEAGLKPKDIILEAKLRGYLLEQLEKKGMRTLREVTSFCQAYSSDPDGTTEKLGFNRQKLLGLDL